MASSLECLRDRKLVNMRGAGESDGRVAGNEIREVKRSGKVHSVKGLYTIGQVGIDSGNPIRF